MKKHILSLMLALLLALAVYPALAETGTKAGILTYQDIRVVVNGEEVPLSGIEPFLMDGTIYLPLSAVPGAAWDDATKTIYIGEKPQAQAASHCWVLTDVKHEVDEDEYDGARTWLYDYQDIPGGGRYIIDYTWQHNEEYAHYTAVGEITDPPATVLPDQVITVDIREYNENVVGDRGWGIMAVSGCQYNRDVNAHYVFTKGFYSVVNGEYTYEAKTYNAADGDQAWQMWATFPEGVTGETINFTCMFHRGDTHPVRTTWTYAWQE